MMSRLGNSHDPDPDPDLQPSGEDAHVHLVFIGRRIAAPLLAEHVRHDTHRSAVLLLGLLCASAHLGSSPSFTAPTPRTPMLATREFPPRLSLLRPQW